MEIFYEKNCQCFFCGLTKNCYWILIISSIKNKCKENSRGKCPRKKGFSYIFSWKTEQFLHMLDVPFEEKIHLLNRQYFLPDTNFNCVVLSWTAQKMKFYIKDFFNKCDHIRSFIRIWSHLLKKRIMNFIFCTVM